MKKVSFYAIGDCNTSGADGLDKAETIPALLNGLLRDAGREVVLTNLGQTMNTSREGVSRVASQVSRPDLMLINFGLADAWVTSLPQVYVPYYPDSSWRRLGRRLLKICKRRLRSPFARRLVRQGEVVPPDEYRANIMRMVAMARAENPGVCIILWSTPWARNSPVRNENIARYNGFLRDLATELNLIYCDVWPVLERIPEEEAYLDEVHLTGRSAGLIARQMFEAIVESGCLGERS